MAKKGPLTRQQSINAMCKQCIYDPVGGCGTWRKQVENCTSTKCPLYPYRPISRVSAPDGVQK